MTRSRLGLFGLARVGYLLRRAQMAVFEDFARRFAALDLTPAQFSTLVAIGDNPGKRQSDIAAALGVQRPNFVAMMDELERRGARRAGALRRRSSRQRAAADARRRRAARSGAYRRKPLRKRRSAI